MNDIDKAIADYLTAQGVIIEAFYKGVHEPPFDPEHLADIFRIKITREGSDKEISTPFWQGMGQRSLRREARSVCRRLLGDDGVARFVLAPTAASVLDYLFTYASYGEQTFDDFCSESGRDTDSRKALDTYLDYQAMRQKLTRFFSFAERERLHELLANYRVQPDYEGPESC